ncbi:MAG TPA: LysM domain-containing protein [Polyangia bacterium]|nr:LysM domain-containing protein [Polyangia bacterium]
MEKRLFALDHNFPEPVLKAFASVMPMVEVVPVRLIDAAWAEVDDWELIAGLCRHPRPWDGLITNDDAMLSLPKEMTVLSQTGLTLVVAKGEGHNPIRAVGALLCHLPHVCHHTKVGLPQIWNLRVTQKNHDEVGDYLTKIAEKHETSVASLMAANRVPISDLKKSAPP